MTRRTRFVLAAAAGLGLWSSACGGGTEVPDTGSNDAPALADALVPCGTDDECEDGLACNGQARCDEGRCVAGEPLRCDDAIACTMDFCSEDLRRCVNRALDADLDGVTAASCVDARGMPLGTDCDDGNARVHPGASELCDAEALDEDCDPATLGGRDGDGDGFVDVACCNGARCGDDCNDAVRGASPAGTEVCNGIDDDCDGMIDQGVLVTVYRDADGDGRGATTMSSTACASSPGYAAEGGDCDDTSAARSPGLPEICDGIDNDCDGTPDPADTAVVATWYADGDGDGFGDLARPLEACAPPAGHSLLGTDCDDTNAARHPAQAELCNGIDDDCNGLADFLIGPGDGEDDDRDGRVDAACSPTPSEPDCDDRDASTSGDSPEVCDGRDNDCDGLTDEGVTSSSYYRDEDSDGWGSAIGGVTVGCGAVAGYSARSGDCDDRSSLRYPDAVEGCNGVDEDCDGRVDEDPSASICPAGAMPQVCVAGRCRDAPECPAGRGDCDGLSSNGCESDLTMDTTSCGVCGRRCAAESGARGACVASRCSPLACDPGYLDCNGDLGRGGDGCERPLSCGACGTGGAAETCANGVDDNCDGRIDEGCCTAGVACTTSCGSTGSLACNPGGTSTCVAPSETCNARDDDCDGLRDEGCCVLGAACTTSCGSTGARACLPMAVPGACEPPSEACNGVDDDCDGPADEGFGPASCGDGVCRRTVSTCVSGVPQMCVPGTPGTETCNALDDDCDGTVDEGFGAPVVCGIGACERMVPGCPVGGMMMACVPGAEGVETCNGIDDDCDGTVDDGFGLATCGVGACQRSIPTCVMGVPQTCTAGTAGTETCNGIDDNCDGTIDDGLGSTTCGTGACIRTITSCVGGMLQMCVSGAPGIESCNGIDDDCNTSVDDGFMPATCGVGACFRSVASCVGGMPVTCVPGSAGMEYCNGVDDDCNGAIDNSCPSSVGRGTAMTGPVFGGMEVFVLDCPAGSAVVGFAGNSGALLDRLVPYCAPLSLGVNTLSSPDYTYTVETGTPFAISGVGAPGGGPFGPDLCPANQIVVGIRGGVGDNVDRLQLQCASVTLTRGAGWAVVVTPTVPTGAYGGTGGGLYSNDCPAGHVTVGFAGEASKVLNSIGQRCAPVTVGTL